MLRFGHCFQPIPLAFFVVRNDNLLPHGNAAKFSVKLFFVRHRYAHPFSLACFCNESRTCAIALTRCESEVIESRISSAFAAT